MIRSVIHWLHRYIWSLSLLFAVGLLLWLTWSIPSWFPGWHLDASDFVDEHLLFVVALSLSLVVLLFWLLLGKLPRWQVAYVFNEKDRIDLEVKVRQRMAQMLGGAALLAVSISPRRRRRPLKKPSGLTKRRYGRPKRGKSLSALPKRLTS
jgi:hypothetical protein